MAFKKNLGVKKPDLLPLEVQMEMEREKERLAEEAEEAAKNEVNMDRVHFRAAGSGYDSRDEDEESDMN